MPTTRSQAVEEKTRVFEESPASPSAHTHAHTKTRTVANDTVTTETLTSRAAMIHAAATEARGSRAPSVRSHRSTASAVARIRQAELEAEEQLVEIKRQELQLQSLLIKKRLAADVATIREETDRESLCAEEPTDANRRVNDWLQKTQVPIRGECDREPRRISPPPAEAEIRMTRPYVTPNVTNEETVQRRPRSLTPDRSRDRGIDRLADALERMAGSRSSPRHIQDLPTFMGSITDWLPFKAAYRESTNIYRYSATENMIRLRTCLKGEARQSVSALLYTANNPDVIINTLEQCYGRPEVIIDHAMEDIKKLPRMGTTASELNGFAVKVQNIVAVITAVDEKGYLQNPMLVRQITERLTPHLKSKWCDYAEEFGNRDEPEIITLSRFLMREADRAVRHAYSTSDSTIVRNPIVKHTVPPNRASERYRQANKVYSVACDVTKKSSTRSMCCFLCGNEHRTSQCSKLNDMSVAERWNWAKETRICFLCLDSKHRRTECKARKCGKNECRQPHHALLHLPPKEDNVIAASAHRPGNDEQVLLKVCPVYITKNDGGTLKTYALLDEGSTITLIDEEIARMVGAEGPARTLNIQGVTSVQREIDSQEVDLRIQGEGQSDCHRIKARTVRNLILGKQTVKPELCKRSYLKGMCEKSMCYSDVRPRILIGADNWHLIVTRRLLSRKNNEPAASLTRLGWVLHGKTPRSSIIQQNESVLHVRTCQENVCERDDELSALVKSHFDIDSLGISKIQKPNAREERAKDVFERTVCRIDGRFEVGLPWTTDEVVMPPSYDMASNSLRTKENDDDVVVAHTVTCDTPSLRTIEKKEDRWHVETTNSRYEDEDDVVVAHTVTCDTPVVKIERFSSYERAKRTVAYVFAFIDKCRKRADTMNITHIKKAEQFLIKLSQKDSFPEEIARLAAGKNVDRTSRLYKLDPMYGTDGIIRLNGRINASSVHIKMKEPPILDGAHHLSLLIIRNSHKNNHHSGREHIVNEIRQQYWILRLRPSVKKALRECGLCRLRKSAPVVPVKGDLPNARLDAYTRPFSRCGVDCFGPMTVTIGRRREKRWGMLFTCLVTRAIHIETVASLSTDSAIMSLRRMAARRGWPEIMWSDNGTNFRGASVELNIAYREWIPQLQNYVLSKRTEWKFTDPGAPNQGGAWERLIRSVKTALAVTLNERAPREEVLATVLTEIEHTVNSRPLTYVASEYDDAEALTPNHFLIGSATGVPHVGECQPADKKSWRAAQALANMFWSRWLREYLPTLTPRGDVRTRNNDQIKVGNLVVIADGLLPRNVWPKGQVEKIYVGPDGVVRSADVRTRGGTFRRPVRRLIVLPGEDGLEDLRRGEAVTDR